MLYFRVDFLKLIQKIRICCKNLFIIVNTRVNPAVYFQSRLFQCYNLSFSKRTFATIRFRLRLKTVLFSWVLRTTLIVSKKRKHIYHIDWSVLLEKTPLVKFIRNYIREPSDVMLTSLFKFLLICTRQCVQKKMLDMNGLQAAKELVKRNTCWNS